MKRIACIVIIFTHVFLGAQNLVPNGSFETYTNCSTPCSINNVSFWINPTQWGTPDYFNSCSGTCSTPVCNIGGNCYQIPHTGNAYSGIYTWGKTVTNGREYLQTNLTSTLAASNLYLVSYYANLLNGAMYGSNNISFILTNNQPVLTGTNSLLYYPSAISCFNNPIIKDTTTWVSVQAIYLATGNEQYLTIGNFNNDNSTDTLKVNPSVPTTASYYFIDDVSVENITTPQWQYRDTTIYLGDSVLIGPAITGLNVDWFDMSNTFIKNAPGIYVKPIVTTPYKATETFNSVVYNHTVTVTVLLPSKVDEYNKLQKSVTIFPNPNKGNVSIQFTDLTKGNVDVTITDVTGKIVYENKLSVSNALTNFTIDVKSGIYFVKIHDSSLNKTLIKKLVVQQ